MSDQGMALSDDLGGVWGQHLEYLVEDWQYEVANGNTRSSYWDWVLSRIE